MSVIYDLRTFSAVSSRFALRQRPRGAYEALLDLHRAASLSFDLRDVVRQLAVRLTEEGSVE